MQIHLITIFPQIFDSYLGESILKRAQKKGAVKIVIHDLRDYTLDKHNKVDDRPYGGGPGMVMQVEPIVRALKKIVPRKTKFTRVLLTSAKGKTFVQADARKFSKVKKLVLICGHYEGVDERVMKYIDGEISIGNYVLTGGELPALVIADAVVRLLPGVLGSNESSTDESHETPGLLEYPQYTRPEVFNGQKVPKELLSGNHKNIADWRKAHKKKQ
ncbi:MAG: tRNA (guanosine(37)-N1)-methyltransferase TrmD [Candidatus Kerfeldbacteria bacterium CG08_land_8_20_14_0_20_42_7]|uniref:tRNA (guanine-N(1)-)-methyltransferase n=1 Tax=Candidatus Kerfeldbacteria bacterium CG08_land_8_20_14_0_20_42_7 TaxID=2014245 RepID=A0A2H0YU24_9BACT|nr:MAG: tRNA (guanosine(37)-N1)-methyltransferase TrmD [Candidatus Kerfeldbacteria bacterium CG08_land_8_20_14_0_20_42_7]